MFETQFDLSDEEIEEILRIDDGEEDAELDPLWSKFLQDLTADFRR